jgi:tetratricopeptide (TPR) repeat protein
VLEQLDRSTAGNAVDVIARVPMVADCADAERLQAETAPPAAGQRAAVDRVRARLSQAMALDRAGRSREALETATAALAAAERSEYPPIVADAALARGRILLARRDIAPAIVELGRARTVALEHRQFAVAVEAAARKLYLEGMHDADVKALQRDAEVFIPLSKALQGEHFAGPLLLNNVGAVYEAAGHRSEATRSFQQARAALSGVEAPDLELTAIDRNLALLTPEPQLREALALGVWQRLGRELGESHLDAIDALEAYGRYVAEPARALPWIARACDDYKKFHPEMIKQRVHCESYRAFLTGERGDHAQERRLYEDIVALAAGTTDEDTVALATLAAGYAGLLRGDRRGAIADLQQAVRLDSPHPDWWVRVRVAHAELGLALAERALGHDREATHHIETALAAYNIAVTMNEEAEYRLRAALARRTLTEIERNPSAGSLRK